MYSNMLYYATGPNRALRKLAKSKHPEGGIQMRLNRFVAVITILLAALALSACQVPTPAPPTATPGPRLATSAEDIVGTWQGAGFQDGTYYSGPVPQLEKDEPGLEGEFRFEGTQLHLGGVEASDLAPCLSENAIYEVQLLESDHLMFTAIEEECLWRRGSLEGDLYTPDQ
jgi:hypothetical protein